MSTGSLLTVQELDAGYTAPVIRSVSLDLKPGDRLGFSGPNGCGKSTLMRAIVGMARCFKGKITRPGRGRLAYLAQQHPDGRESPVTGRDVFSLLATPVHGLPERVNRLLDLRLDHMSAGERQLTKAWAVIHNSASVILLDEPTSSLDEDAKWLLAEEVAAFSSARAALIISHDAGFLQHACTATQEFRF